MFRSSMSLTPNPALPAMPPRCAPKPTELALAFAALRGRIAGIEQPFEPKYAADVGDLAEWADHLNDVLGAPLAYAQAVAIHIGHITSGGIASETGGLEDAISEIVGTLRRAANRMHEEAA